MSPSPRAIVIILLTVVAVLATAPVTADWNEGIELYYQGRIAKAAEQFEATVRSNPHWPGGYLMLGRCQLATDQYEEALAKLGKAAELGPGDPDPANAAALARALMAVDRHTEAREMLERLDLEALELGWRAEVARMRARCLLAEDRAAGAVGLLQACLSGDPDRAALHQAIARVHLAMGDREAALDRDDEAIKHLREGLGAPPEPELAVRIHAQLGRLLACRLELPEAARQYRAAGDTAPASQIDESAAGFEQALERLKTLRGDTTKLAAMEAELEELGDANGVAALTSQRETMNREIAGIEDDLSQVRAALWR